MTLILLSDILFNLIAFPSCFSIQFFVDKIISIYLEKKLCTRTFFSVKLMLFNLSTVPYLLVPIKYLVVSKEKSASVNTSIDFINVSL